MFLKSRYKVCDVCGNPNISSYWSAGIFFYCSFKCQTKGLRYWYLVVSLISYLVVIFLISVYSSAGGNVIVDILMLCLPLIFLIPAIYGFVVKIDMFQSNQSKLNGSSRNIMNEDNLNNLH